MTESPTDVKSRSWQAALARLGLPEDATQKQIAKAIHKYMDDAEKVAIEADEFREEVAALGMRGFR